MNPAALRIALRMTIGTCAAFIAGGWKVESEHGQPQTLLTVFGSTLLVGGVLTLRLLPELARVNRHRHHVVATEIWVGAEINCRRRIDRIRGRRPICRHSEGESIAALFGAV